MLNDATAARVAQTDQKGWKGFAKEVNDSIRSLVLSKFEMQPARDQQRMAGFFQQLATAKGRLQHKGKL